MEPSIFYIPSTILMEILSKLPISTICNCKCVCSYFRNLISDPQFSQLILSRSSPSLLLCSNDSRESSLYSIESINTCDVESDIDDDICIPSSTLLKFYPGCDGPAEGLEVLSSCNGLICFHWPRTCNPYVICNPVINEYVIVPQIEKRGFDQCSSGFGFCSGTNQYKVLRLLYRRTGFGVTGKIKLEAEINTLGTNLWRRVGDALSCLHWYPSGCFLNGALHWMLGVSLEQIKIGVLKDGLSIFHRPINYMLDIWVMKDYAAQESWTKDFVIKIPNPYNNIVCQPLMVLSNSDILMSYALSTLLSWNTRDGSIRKGNTLEHFTAMSTVGDRHLVYKLCDVPWLFYGYVMRCET
ncbi:hypothetical protein C3L33_11803, partial [Rhododendron williamsianum]